MIVTRANLNGGRPLRGYPLTEDQRTGFLGYKLGYCSGCNEPVSIRTVDIKDVVNHFGLVIEEKEGDRISFRQKVILWLGGRIE